MSFAVDTSQLDAAAASLRQLSSELGDLTEADRAAASLVAQASQPLAPHRTGALRASLTVRAGAIVSQLPYAVPVHFGWRRDTAVVAGRPFVLQARDQQIDNVLDTYAQHVTQLLERVD